MRGKVKTIEWGGGEGGQGVPNFLLALNDRRGPPPTKKYTVLNSASPFRAFWTHSKCNLSASD